MENRSKLLDEFEAACRDLDDARTVEVLDLSDRELAEVADGVARLGDPVRAACQVVLDDWPRLDASGRLAALLMLANALASAANSEREGHH